MSEDLESRFLYALLSANSSEQEKFYSRQIPKGVFSLRVREVKWAYDHRERFGAYPSLKTYETFFKEQLPRHREKVSAVLQPILDMGMFNQMRRVQLKIKKMLENGDSMEHAMEVYKAEAQRLTAYSVSYTDINFAKDRGSFDRFAERARSRVDPDSKARILSPWNTLNQTVRFFSPGEVLGLVARTSIAKTWLALYWGDYLASKGHKVLFLTKEMIGEKIADRLSALQFRLDYDLLRDGNLNLKERLRWNRDIDRLERSDYEFIILGDETEDGIGLGHISAKIKEHRPDVVILDGAYLIPVDELGKGASRSERLEQLSKRIGHIARSNKVFLVEVLQINRKGEDRPKNGKGGGARASIADIYGSDGWAQGADLILEISGNRGAPRRVCSLLKGRESGLCSYPIRAEFRPYPRFDETASLSSRNTSGQIEFKGVE